MRKRLDVVNQTPTSQAMPDMTNHDSSDEDQNDVIEVHVVQIRRTRSPRVNSQMNP